MVRNAGAELEELEGVMARLREQGGCPWDREQDLRSLRPFLLEEAFEVLEEMDRVGYGGDWEPLCEELGDLLFQIVFHAQLAAERGAFSLADVCLSIREKIVRRHPHVFAKGNASSAEEVLANWAQLKAEERKKKTGLEGSALDGVPVAAPALLRAERLTEKASRVGFDWPDAAGARAKLSEELAELDQAARSGDRDALEHELGDVLLSVVNLSRFLKTPPEDALRQAIHRFTRRFQDVEAGLHQSGVAFGKATLAELDAHWEQAKAREAGVPPPRLPAAAAPLRVTFALPHATQAAPWREEIFRHLGWKQEALPAGGAVYWDGGQLAFAFVSGQAEAGEPPSLSFEATSRAQVAELHARLSGRGFTLAAPRTLPHGGVELTFQDPSGAGWSYATR